jgi:exodeoxyribonuclease VII large subunit
MSQASLFNLMPERRVWKVSELNARVRDLLETSLPDLWLEGEVSNFHAAQSGHLYFTLKDARSQIRCVCFRDQVRGLKFRPEDGLHITVRGSLSVYEPRGEYQIYVSHIEPVGAGALQLAFEQLKKRLAEEGLFAESRKKSLPVLPRCIGVVTSPTGAAIRDILRVLKRRFSNAHVMLYPVKVQGDGAAREIVEALRHFNRAKIAEVIIVARGGGSLEDLWAFNEEIVVRAIAASEIAVITGIGHETDFTIADFVADVRAPTPSAAAEIVVRSRQEFERHIAEHYRHVVQQMRYRLSEWRHRARDLQTHRAFRQLEVLVRRRRQQVDEMSSSLAIGLRLRLAMARQRLGEASAHIVSFDLRGRGQLLRRRIERERGALGAPRSIAWSRASAVGSPPRKSGLPRSICAPAWAAFIARSNSVPPNCKCVWIARSSPSAAAGKPPRCNSKSAARSKSSSAATPSPTMQRGKFYARPIKSRSATTSPSAWPAATSPPPSAAKRGRNRRES